MEKSILKIGISSVLLLILVAGCNIFGGLLIQEGFVAKAVIVANSNNLDPVHVDFLDKNVRLAPGEMVHLEKVVEKKQEDYFKIASVQEPLKLIRMGQTYYQRMIVIKDSDSPVRIMIHEEQEWGKFRVTYTQ